MLSKVQIKVLTQLSEKDDSIHLMSTFDPHAWLYFNMKTVSLATLDALRKKGMLKLVKEDWSGGEYKISDKGVKAIEGE